MKAARYFRTLLVAGMFAASILGSEANSAIVEADWQAVNDGLLTEDTSTGLKWLDLTETANMSFNDVSALLGAGGTFDGFRYATSAE